MVTHEHQGLVDLLRKHPALVAQLLGVLSAPVPPYARADAVEGDLTESIPPEYRADGVLVFRDTAGEAVLAVVIEVQRQVDRRKELSWPAYAMLTRARERCTTEVLVVTIEGVVADWAERPIRVDSRNTYVPLVLRPELIPRIDDPAAASRDPHLAILSALAHHEDLPVVQATYGALRAALGSAESGVVVEKEVARYYIDLIWTRLGEGIRPAMEQWMREHPIDRPLPPSPLFQPFVDLGREQGKAEGKVEGKAEGKVEGKAEGKAEDLLLVLGLRGLSPTEEQRARILGCDDLLLLRHWLERALNASTVDEIF